jgi:hypothetical protein
VGFEVGDQRGPVGALLAAAQRVDLELDVLEAQVVPQPGAHQDVLGVDVGPSKPRASTPTWWNWR